MFYIAYFKDENSYITPKKVSAIKETESGTTIFDEFGSCICNGIKKSDLVFFDDLKSAQSYFKAVTSNCSEKFKDYVFRKKPKKL